MLRVDIFLRIVFLNVCAYCWKYTHLHSHLYLKMVFTISRDVFI